MTAHMFEPGSAIQVSWPPVYDRAGILPERGRHIREYLCACHLQARCQEIRDVIQGMGLLERTYQYHPPKRYISYYYL